MSVAGISSSSFFDYGAQGVQSRMQQFQKEMQQLGQDLQSGNLSAAQSDFAILQRYAPGSGRAASSQSSSPIGQELSQLSSDLQSGNLAAAQKDYTSLQQDLTSAAAHGHHHHHAGGGNSASNSISQTLEQLGQALQSGNLSSAQQAYATLQQDFQQFTQVGVGSSVTGTPRATTGVAVSA